MLRCPSFMQVKCNCYRMRKIVLTVKRGNCKTPLPEAASRFILQKNLFIESTYKSVGETPNNEHLLPSNFLSNHIEVKHIIGSLSTELQDPKNNFPKENKPREAVHK